MKCPKCHYISFDDPQRCRNCGFELSLASTQPPAVDLPIRTGQEPVGPPADLDMGIARGPRAAGREPPASTRVVEDVELPLFHGPVPGVDDTPLITAPAPPRAPLSVRRSAEPGRGRTVTPVPRRAEEPRLSFATAPPQADEVETGTVDTAAPEPPSPIARRAAPGHVMAALPRRVVAGMIDLVLLGGIDAAVVWFTLQLTGFPQSRVLELPWVPLAAFLALLNGGYLVTFTAASGQTIGKMLTGIRVVGETSTRVPLGHAVVRAAASMVSILPLGLGFLPAIISADRRALHDRLSNTRVEPL